MSKRLFFAVTAVLVALSLFISCADTRSPTLPMDPATSARQESTADQAGHHLWASYLIYYDPAGMVMEMVPQRGTSMHLNVLTWLEQGPWPDCVELVGLKANPDGTFDVDVRIRHPFTSPSFTGFDVRGIVMFEGSHQFPGVGISTSDRSIGEGQLLNADGFTTLYNPSTAAHAPLEGYLKGNFAPGDLVDAQLNGFKRFISDPSLPRAVFRAAGQVTVTYTVYLPPAPLVFGYAVDASWVPAISKPVDDPWSDFGLEANCPEAWNISVTEAPGANLTECGGPTTLTIDVYDWQGKDLSHPVLVECPELFDGQVVAGWMEDGADYVRYQATIENENYAQGGSYMCLVSKPEDAPPDKAWMDPTAYQIYTVTVIEAGVPTDPVVVKVVATPDSAWRVAAAGGYAYVPIHDSLLVIDVIPPETAHIVRTLDCPTDVGDVVISGDFAYVIGGGGLLIIDVDPPEEANILYDIDAPYGGHLAVSGGFAYKGGTDGLHIIDIEPPDEAHLVNTVDTPEDLMAVDVSGEYAYAPDFKGDLVIIDIDPPESAFIENILELPSGPTDIDVSGGYAYIVRIAGLLTDGRLHIVDVDPPQDAWLVRSVGLQDPPQSVAYSCGYAYAAVAGSGPETADGLAIIDVDPPEDAHRLAVVTHGGANRVAVSGRYAYEANSGGALVIIQLW